MLQIKNVTITHKKDNRVLLENLIAGTYQNSGGISGGDG